MREKHTPSLKITHRSRITPAYAGRTMQIKRSTHLAEDHPRVCGKNLLVVIVYPFLQGSPPRMREKLTKYGDYPATFRITPAYAGKTCSHSRL